MAILKRIALVVFILAVGPALWIGIRFMPEVKQLTPPTPIELIGTVFAAVTIILGVLAIVIAVLAIWGYGAIKAEAKEAATSAAKTAAILHIESEDVQARLREESRRIIEEEVKKLQEGLAIAESQPAQATPLVQTREESRRVGRRYSKGKEG